LIELSQPRLQFSDSVFGFANIHAILELDCLNLIESLGHLTLEFL